MTKIHFFGELTADNVKIFQQNILRRAGADHFGIRRGMRIFESVFRPHRTERRHTMYIRKLSLLNFKNIAQADLALHEGINCFTGRNGAGKTNVIDAVWYLSMCKSALTMTDGQSIRHGEEFFLLNGEYTADGGRFETVTCSFRRGGGKVLKRNGKEYERLSDHIGMIPSVIVSPADIFLVSDAADERRKWLNAFISQHDREYLNALIRYNRALAERNRLLKQLQSPQQGELLEVFDMQLAAHGRTIHAARAAAIEELRPIVADYYRIISDDREQISLDYRSELNDTEPEALLEASRPKDIANQFTTSGVHRDDMVMRIGGYPLRKYGSQGQQKSFLIALKLAQHAIQTTRSGERPILLLDDLFDKLDAGRLEALISLVNDARFGQILISDCNRSRLTSILESCHADYAHFLVEAGAITQEQ